MKIILRHGEKSKTNARFSCLCGCIFLAGDGDYSSRKSRMDPDKTVCISTCPECEREGIVGTYIGEKRDEDAD